MPLMFAEWITWTCTAINAPEENPETETFAGSMLSWGISDSDRVCAMALATGARADRTPKAKDVITAAEYLLIVLVISTRA
jgi:hypothetical protein